MSVYLNDFIQRHRHEDGFGTSSEEYAMRRRRWARQAGMGDITMPESGAVVGGEVGGIEALGNPVWTAIGVGVATGALTFLVNRVLDSWFFSKGKR